MKSAPSVIQITSSCWLTLFELYEVKAILCLQRKWLIVLHLLSMLSPQDNFAMQIYHYKVDFLNYKDLGGI